MTVKEKELITNFGALSFDAEKCALILGWDENKVLLLMSKKDSEFSKLYRTGRAKAQYVTEMKLFEQAQSGDLKALDEFERRIIERE